MTTMVSGVYEAFLDAGASEEKARGAAEVMSSETAATKADLFTFRDEMRDRFARLDKELFLVKWMLGLVVAVEVLPLIKAIFK